MIYTTILKFYEQRQRPTIQILKITYMNEGKIEFVETITLHSILCYEVTLKDLLMNDVEIRECYSEQILLILKIFII